jgi:hypothetical protein
MDRTDTQSPGYDQVDAVQVVHRRAAGLERAGGRPHRLPIEVRAARGAT